MSPSRASRLPPVTHLQFLVLEFLLDAEEPGRAVRDMLRRHGVRRSTPAFYQLMARLEDVGLVRGQYVPKVVRGQTVKERRYELTASGARAYRTTCAFYRDKLGFRNVDAPQEA
jgi:DNA-binding PadR family transcriptional regulator